MATISPRAQYDSSTLFQKGAVLNNYSELTSLDQDPCDFAVGSLNGDAYTGDVAVLYRSTNYFSIYNQTSEGTLSKVPWKVMFTSGSGLNSNITVGDLNGDGYDDIVISYVRSNSAKITILYQNEQYSDPSSSTMDIGTGSIPHQIVIGKFNNTVNNDIAVACTNNLPGSKDFIELWRWPFINSLSNSRYFNIPDVSFDAQLLSGGFINNDGKTDLVVGNYSGSNVCTFITPDLPDWLHGDWSAPTKLIITGPLTDVKLLNLNSDSLADLAVVNSATHTIQVYYNSASSYGSNPLPVITAYSGLKTITAGYITGSSHPDLISISSAGNNVSLYASKPAGEWWSSPNSTAPTNLNPLKAITDASDPLHLGVYVLSKGRNGQPGALEFFKVTDKMCLNADAIKFLSGKSPNGITSGVLSPGVPVLASVLSPSNQVYVYDINGKIGRTLSTQIDPDAISIGDFDGDGYNDVIVANKGSTTLTIYSGATSIFSKSTYDQSIPIPSGLTAPQSLIQLPIQASTEDIVVGCDGGIAIIYTDLMNPGTQVHQAIPSDGNITAICAGDFNGDGVDLDLAVLNKDLKQIEMYIYNPAATPLEDRYSTSPIVLDTRSQIGLTATLVSMASGDYDHDGLDELMIGDDSANIEIFKPYADGFHVNQRPDSYLSLPDAAQFIETGDLNDDGRDDFVVGYQHLPEIGVFLNKSGSGFVNLVNYTTGGLAAGLFVGDVNGDGRDDIASSSTDSSSLSMWFQNDLVPVASFQMDGQPVLSKTIDEGTIVSFDASSSIDSFSDLDSLQYHWDFGDGNTSSEKTVSHNYTKSRAWTYNGTLTVTDRSGLSNTTRFNITVNDRLPIASFAPSPSIQIEGSPIQFTSTSYHYDPITNWTWEFGDGSYSYVQDPSHTFQDEGNGTYYVKLTITDADGKVSNVTSTVTITDILPVAEFTASATTISEGGTVSFTDDSYSYDQVTNYTWDFGDDSPLVYTKNAQHQYRHSGTYTALLTITDDHDTSPFAMDIVVRDVPPTPSFTPSNLLPHEGEAVTFTDATTHYALDTIISYRWSMGDSSNILTTQNVTYWYMNAGIYTVTLNVTDSSQVSREFSMNIVVQPTNPTIVSLKANGGQSTIDMDTEIEFDLVAQQIPNVPITAYEWDFNYSPARGFQAAPGYSAVQSIFSYHVPGQYTICARVHDSNSFSEVNITVNIRNPAPVASLLVQEIPGDPGNFTMDASLSWDTASDNSSLQYSWNFGDAQGSSIAWGPVDRVTYNYTADGRYTITLNVRDQWGKVAATTYSVLVDRSAPDIQFEDGSLMTQIYMGEETVVLVRVTDLSTISEVRLVYTYAGETKTIIMTPVAGGNVYAATLPAFGAAGNLTYYIEAVDGYSHASFTTPVISSIVERPDYSWAYIAVLMAIACLLAFLVYFRSATMVVDEVFIIYKDGNLLAHQTRRLKPGMDDQILGSMLVAIQSFVKDSFKDESSTGLNRMDFGEKKVLVERGDNIYLAVVLHGKREGRVPKKMKNAIERTEDQFKDALTDWDGDLEKVRGIKDETDPLLKGNIRDILPLQDRKNGGEAEGSAEADEEAGARSSPAETFDCPVCDKAVPIDSKKCPHCGSDFSQAEMGDLEDLAREIKKD